MLKATRTSPLSFGVRTQIGVAFSLLAALLFGAIGLISAQEARQRSEQQTAAMLQQLAERLAQRLDADMAARYRDVVQLVATQAILSPGLAPQHWRPLLDQLKASMRHYSWIGVASPDGVVSSATDGLLVGKNVQQRPWFQAGLRAPAVGDVHEAVLLASLLPRTAGNDPLYFVDVTAPLRADGRTVGVVGAHLSWAWAEERRREALTLLSPVQQVDIVLVNQQSAIVLGPASPALVGAQAPFAGARTQAWADGGLYLTATAPSRPYADYPGMGWTVVVRQPATTAFAAARALERQLWLLGLIGALLFGAVGWWLAGRLTAPLRQVAERARALSPELHRLGRDDEVAQLAHSLAGLIEGLHERDQALTAINADLEQRVRSRTESLARANADLKTFSASVSHDLRGPLGAMAMLLRTVVERSGQALDARDRRGLDLVATECDRLCQLTTELLTLATIDQRAMGTAPVAMTALAQAALDEVRRSQPSAHPTVNLPPLPEVPGDALMLQQVWSNLLGNAFKFSAKVAAPHITIRAERGPHEVVYTVADNGAGFDMAQAERLFGNFQRLHSAAEFAGTGVGLSIVRRVISRHGGRVWAEAAVGQGAQFHFALPLVAAGEQLPAESSSPTLSAAPAA